MARIDVTVRGAGIFGLSVAYACAERGAKVRVIDPGGVGAGASGGIVGALAPHTPERWNAKKEFQFQSLIAAEPFWDRVDQLSGLASGYGRTGRLQPVADGRALTLSRDRAVEAATLWRGWAHWRLIDAAKAGPWAPASPTGWLIEDSLSARLHPRHACDSLAGAIRALGGEVVDAGEDDGAVIWATGVAGLTDLSRAVGRDIGTGVKGQAALFQCDARHLPQIFADALHIVPHADGTVAVGSTTERDFTDPTATDGQLDAIIDRARAVCPALADAPVLARWAGVRPRARSRAPVLGAWPGRPGHFIANGGFKIGFGMAPKMAEVMAALVLDGRDEVPPDFRIETVL